MLNPSGRVLYVTHTLPSTPRLSAAGIARRQQLFIEAIKKVSTDIEILLYTHHQGQEVSEIAKHLIEAQLGSRWGGSFKVTLCRREAPTKYDSFWHHYIKPATSFFCLPGYANFSGSSQVEAFNVCLGRQPDYIFVHRLTCMPPLLLTSKKLPPVFLDLDDVEHVALTRSISQPPLWISKRLEYLQLPALMFGEWRAIRLSEKTFVCSGHDQNLLQRLFKVTNIESIPNVVPIPDAQPLASAQKLLFLGNYRYPPNRIGAEFFLDRIWPRIRTAVPDAQVTIAGLGSDCIRHYQQPPDGVFFPGFVDDLDALYADAKVVICPILSGGGTRVKIMEAAAYGKPIVSTTIGAEGIELKNETEILLRDSPENFAAGCIDLLTDYERACRIGEYARLASQERYEFSQIVGWLAQLLQSSINRANK